MEEGRRSFHLFWPAYSVTVPLTEGKSLLDPSSEDTVKMLYELDFFMKNTSFVTLKPLGEHQQVSFKNLGS